MGENKSAKYKLVRQMGMLTVIPVLLAIAPLVGFFLGKLVDHWLDKDPIFQLIGLGFGFAAGVRETILILKQANAAVDEDGTKPE